MAFVRVGDIDVCYEVHGAGPRVVLISGTGGDLRVNPNRASDPLTAGHEVLMYDQRGLGRTSKPDEPSTMERYADDAAELMDALDWDRAHVVGISFGGMVAQHVALRHPERVDRLVLCCTSAGGAGGSSFDLLSLADLPREERAELLLPIMDTRNDLSTDPPTLAPLFERLAPFMVAPPLNADDPASELGARRQLEARAGHDVYDRLGEIDMPTLVAGGLHDGQAPPENLERLAAALPDATLRFFEGGHMFLLQDRTAWPAIIDFLAA
ncbi:MAG: alpha/beta hydrolase [Acidimicrobiaceae bacterium]|nr:alpha/beta hydrolase [Acidimicrobiaceae bacterium]